MTIRLDPGVLAGIIVPDSVHRACDESLVHTVDLGIADLPAPFNTARIWVACREAWPHNDPDFEGMMFISVVIQAAHRYSQMGEGNVVETMDVRPGCVFATNPLALHWLEPLDPDMGFIALQWEVPFHEYEQRMKALIDAIGSGVAPEKVEISTQQGLIYVDPEIYTSAPPGHPSLGSVAM